MAFLVSWIRSPQLDRIETTLARLESTINEWRRHMSNQESELNVALAAVGQNVTDVRGGVDAIIAKLNERTDVDLSDETAALQGLATSLQDAEDKLSAATNPVEPPPEG